IVDPTPAGQELSKTIGVVNFNSLDDLLEARRAKNIQVDAAIIAVPNHVHIPVAVPLVQNGISVLVEKPLSTESASARELLKVGEQVRLQGSPARILVGHHRRFNPYIQLAKKAIS